MAACPPFFERFSLPLLPVTDENALAFDHARLIGDALLHLSLVKER